MKNTTHTLDLTRLEHMCQICNRNTAGCHRVRLQRGGKFIASVHAECALGVSWTENVIAEPVLTVEASPEVANARAVLAMATKGKTLTGNTARLALRLGELLARIDGKATS